MLLIRNVLLLTFALAVLSSCTYQQIAAWNQLNYSVSTAAAVVQRQEMIRQQEIANSQQQILLAQNAEALRIARDAEVKDQIKDAVEKAKREAIDEVRDGVQDDRPRKVKSKKRAEAPVRLEKSEKAGAGDFVRCKIGSNPPVLINKSTCDKAGGEKINE